MKYSLVLTLLVGLTLGAAPLDSAETASDPKAQLEQLVDKIREKLKNGESTAAALSEEIKAFDALLKQHEGVKTDEVAHILYMKATLYTEVLDDTDTGVALLEQLAREYPDTEPARMAQSMIKATRMQAQLAVGKPFPDFDEKDLDGQPLSLAKFKGRVVLVDFWATWCGPCIGELPNVLDAYKQYHAEGFEIIGISLDNDRDKLTSFLKQKQMTWPQYFDGRGWQTKLAQDYGINSIPATFLIDAQGTIIGKDLRGPALGAAVGKALGK